MQNAECADLFVALCFHVLREYGADAAIFAAGPMLKRAILAAETLASQGIHTTLGEIHTFDHN